MTFFVCKLRHIISLKFTMIPGVFDSWLAGMKIERDIPSYSFSFILKEIFAKLPPPDPTAPIEISDNDVRMLKYCCNLSKMVYVRPRSRKILPELGHIVFDERHSSLYNIPYFITDSDELNRIFVTLRGSYCVNDFLVDIQLQAFPWKGGYVHTGVYLTAVNLFHSIQRFLKKLVDSHGGRPVTITGHSLGGGCAALLVEMMRDKYPDMVIDAVVFAPCATCTRDLCEQSVARVRSYCIDGDFVPFLSLTNFERLPEDQVPKLVMKAIKKAVKARAKRPVPMEVKPLPSDFNPFEADLVDINRFIGTTRRIADARATLYPPGDLFLLVRDKGQGEKFPLELHKIASVDYFGHLVNHLNELRHRMDTYRKWVTSFCNRRLDGVVEVLSDHEDGEEDGE